MIFAFGLSGFGRCRHVADFHALHCSRPFRSTSVLLIENPFFTLVRLAVRSVATDRLSSRSGRAYWPSGSHNCTVKQTAPTGEFTLLGTIPCQALLNSPESFWLRQSWKTIIILNLSVSMDIACMGLPVISDHLAATGFIVRSLQTWISKRPVGSPNVTLWRPGSIRCGVIS